MILFIDTHDELITIGLKYKDDLFVKTQESEYSHSVYVMPMIESIFKENNLDIKDLEKIVVVNGPGSFTGTRIGVTVGKTFCYSNNINVIPVSSLKQYIFSLDNYDYYVSIIKDKGNRLYYGIYDKDYNDIVTDKYNYLEVFEEDISKLNGKIAIISEEGENTIKPKLDIIKLMEYYKDFGINPHYLKPNYLKKIEVEEKL